MAAFEKATYSLPSGVWTVKATEDNVGLLAMMLIMVLGGLCELFSGAPYVQTPNNGNILHHKPESRVAGPFAGLSGGK